MIFISTCVPLNTLQYWPFISPITSGNSAEVNVLKYTPAPPTQSKSPSTFWQQPSLHYFLPCTASDCNYAFVVVQNRNITGSSPCRPPHACTQRMHRRTWATSDPQSPRTCVLLFFWLWQTHIEDSQRSVEWWGETHTHTHTYVILHSCGSMII